MKGKQQYDQDWIDSNTEAGVGACRWQRPAARPPELDSPAPVNTTVGKAPIKKRSIIQRAKDRVRKVFHRKPKATKNTGAVVPVTSRPAPTLAAPPPTSVETYERITAPTPEPPKRTPLDDLLNVKP